MKRTWETVKARIIVYQSDVIRTSDFDGGSGGTSKDDFEGEIDWD